ncbi:hypothetical protein [Streptomyces regalis]|uniref:hypothetical protein n=1 Tax=Streptomyces regalis TaxID=68262 RepID=UPI00131B9C36|nr:hypothetical protein [Streptomyces regalis]
MSQTEKWEVGRTAGATTTSAEAARKAGGYWFAPYWRESRGWIALLTRPLS